MTQPEVKTIKRDGSRFYVDPISGAKVPSVTSIVGCLPKRPLMYWRGKMVAEAAVEDFGVVADFISKGNPSAAIDHLKRAPDRSSGVAAKTGSDVHNLCERINRHDLHGHRPHTGHLLQLQRRSDQRGGHRCRRQHAEPYDQRRSSGCSGHPVAVRWITFPDSHQLVVVGTIGHGRGNDHRLPHQEGRIDPRSRYRLYRDHLQRHGADQLHLVQLQRGGDQRGGHRY